MKSVLAIETLSNYRLYTLYRHQLGFAFYQINCCSRDYDMMVMFVGPKLESFPVRFINVTFQIIELLQISLLICDVSPFSNQVFHCFFSMDNPRGYDDISSSAWLGPSSKELPSPSVGTAPPLGTQDAVVAGTSSSVVPVTSGPVPPVLAQPGPSRPGSQDCVTPFSGNKDDLLPPPPPAEPYEDFLAHVGHDQSVSARPAMQPTAVAIPLRQWRRLLALIFLHLSPPLWTHPGCFQTKFQYPGSGSRCLRPSTRLLPHPGCGPDGVPP